MSETPNHGYNVPDEGDENWHSPLNENFEAFEEDIEIRDEGSPQDKDYEAHEGAKYLDTATGEVYVAQAGTWESIGTLPDEFLESLTGGDGIGPSNIEDGDTLSVDWDDAEDLGGTGAIENWGGAVDLDASGAVTATFLESLTGGDGIGPSNIEDGDTLSVDWADAEDLTGDGSVDIETHWQESAELLEPTDDDVGGIDVEEVHADSIEGDTLTDEEPVTSLVGDGVTVDEGAMTTAFLQEEEPPVEHAGTMWVATEFEVSDFRAVSDEHVQAIEFGDNGYVYAGGNDQTVSKFNPGDLGADPLDSFDDGARIDAITWGDDGYLYAGGFADKVHKLNPNNLSGGPIDSYDDGSWIYTIAWGDDGYLYAGGFDEQVYQLDPDNLSDGPVEDFPTPEPINVITWGDDWHFYVAGDWGEVWKFEPGNLDAGPVSIYEDGAPIKTLTWGMDGYLYAGGEGAEVLKLDPDNLDDGPVDSYHDGDTIEDIAWGGDGYIYAGGRERYVHKLDPDALGDGPEISYSENDSILAIEWGTDGSVYIGHFVFSAEDHSELVKLDSGPRVKVSTGQKWVSLD